MALPPGYTTEPLVSKGCTETINYILWNRFDLYVYCRYAKVHQHTLIVSYNLTCQFHCFVTFVTFENNIVHTLLFKRPPKWAYLPFLENIFNRKYISSKIRFDRKFCIFEIYFHRISHFTEKKILSKKPFIEI